MLYPSVDEIRRNDESRYELVILAAKRARDIIDGAPLLIDGMDSEKAVTVAISEIAEGYIKCGESEVEDDYGQDEKEIINEVLQVEKTCIESEDEVCMDMELSDEILEEEELSELEKVGFKIEEMENL